MGAQSLANVGVVGTVDTPTVGTLDARQITVPCELFTSLASISADPERCRERCRPTLDSINESVHQLCVRAPIPKCVMDSHYEH